VLQVDIILLLLTAATLIFSVFVGNPKAFRDPPRHVLICSAHSDDCVIMGAEYAYGANQKGYSIRIAYLTCSGPQPDAKISRTRQIEALSAWSILGVPRENFIFANLPESPTISGPATYSDRDIAYAKEIFKTVILSLPKDSAVIVPAHGESHIDHRIVRKVTLQAIVDSKRDDLLVYECPEYNDFLSLVHCPKKTIRTIMRNIPLMHRVLMRYRGSPNFVSGPAGVVFRDTPSRLAKKRKLLTFFVSQNADLLIRSFGYETPYRRLARTQYPREERAFCVSAFGGSCDLSALVFGITLLALAFLTAYELAIWLTIAFSPELSINKYLVLLGVLVASVYVIRRIRGTANLESSFFVWAAALGLMFGAI
jgi:LmbE family N-acetylglucosaminyl deacetylase